MFLLFQLEPPPEFIAKREELWAKLKKERDDWVAAQSPQPIKITLPDGKVVDGESWKTTPYGVAAGIRYIFWFIVLFCFLLVILLSSVCP